jgi:RNAse (barnase) inhibitor barstar
MKNSEGKDIEILKNGPICKYFKTNVLNEDLIWFQNNKFEIIDMNLSNWTKHNFHKKLKESLHFPDYYGENLDAFNDCLLDMIDTNFKGLILVFRNFDDFYKEDRQKSEAILDIISKQSRNWLLYGKKLIVLLHSKDSELDFPEFGGTSPHWNSSEWFNSDR